MFAHNPGQRIAERNQVLVQRAEGVAPAICKSRESIAKADRRVTKRGKREWTHDCSVRIDITLVETNAGEKSLQGRIAMSQKTLPVEPTTRLVD